MSFVGDLFSGDKGMGFGATPTDVLQPATLAQGQTAYNNALGGIDQQQAFLNALSKQNGIGNQSNVFNQQQGLANMLGAQSLGYGPNPAMAQLSQTTGQNIANQSAMMAGQRGSGANAGLIARQAAQQGGALQQNAVGQAAIMRAQQQIAAQQALQAQQANMANLSTTQVGQQQTGLQQFNQSAQREQELLLNALDQYNKTRVGQQNAINSANAGIANTTAQGQQGLIGGAFKGVSGGIGSMFGANGGMVPHYADGGLSMPPPQAPHFEGLSFTPQAATVEKPHFEDLNLDFKQDESVLSKAGKYLQSDQVQFQPSGMNPGAQSIYEGVAGLGPDIKKMAKAIPAMAMFAADGGPIVPGKADVKGDSLKNDKVPAMLSPGEIIIPRSVVNSEDPVGSAAQFVKAVLAKKRK